MWEAFSGKKKKSSPLTFSQFSPEYQTEILSFWDTLPKLLTYSYLSPSKVFQVALQLQMFYASRTSKIYLLFTYSIYLISYITTL